MKTKYCLHDNRIKCAYCRMSKKAIDIIGGMNKLPDFLWYCFKDSNRSYGRENCRDCGGQNEPTHIHNHIWKLANIKNRKRFLCLACIEKRIGRELILADFSDAPINYGCFEFDCREFIRRKSLTK